MVYSKGNKMISIEKKPIFGKVKPELYIGEDNHLLKVASFGNVEKAEKFEEWLQYFFGDMLVQEPKTDAMRNRLCPRCGAKLKGRYCLECGQAVRWND